MSRATGARRAATSRARGRRNSPGSAMIAGSPNRLRRNGSTASGASGPPRFISTTVLFAISLPAGRAGEQIGEHGDVFGRGLRQDAMPEVEHIGSADQRLPDLADRRGERLAPGKQQN